MKMKRPTTDAQLCRAYEKIRRRALAAPDGPASAFLATLSDCELKVVIAAETRAYGRSLAASWENAEAHLEDRPRAIRLFSRIGR